MPGGKDPALAGLPGPGTRVRNRHNRIPLVGLKMMNRAGHSFILDVTKTMLNSALRFYEFTSSVWMAARSVASRSPSQ